MPAFDIVVVGSGGGLDETNLSGYVSGLAVVLHLFSSLVCRLSCDTDI